MRSFLFRLLHTVSSRYPRWIVFVSLVLAGLSGFYGLERMELITDQDRLLSEELDYHHRYMEFIRRFGDLEFLYILIEGSSEEQKIAFADALATRLSISENIQNIIYKFDTSWAKDYALYFENVKIEDLRKLENELRTHEDQLHDLFSIHSIDVILNQITNSIETGLDSPKKLTEDFSEDLDILLEALKGKYDSPFEQLSELKSEVKDSQDAEYLWTGGKRYLLMLIMPAKDFTTLSVIDEPLKRIRADIWLTEQEFDGVTAGLTGRPALQADEMRTTNKDMKNASIMALAGVFILFILFFREISRPLLAIIALLIAMGWTYGFVALTLGHLNLLSMVFALILIGLGVDFGIHVIHRYQEELKISGVPSGGVQGALFGVGPGILTGALTSSVAFLLALLTNFRGLQELGYVAGMGIIFCLIAMLLLLSSLLVSYDRHFRKTHTPPTPVHLLGLRHVSRYPRLTILAILILSVFLIPKAMEVSFNDNLLELQAENLESVEYEHKLMDESEHSTWYCAFLEPTIQEVRKTVNKLQANPTAAGVESLSDVLPPVSQERKALIESVYSTLSPLETIHTYPYRPNPTIYNELTGQLDLLFARIAQLKEMRRQMEQRLSEQKSLQANHMDESKRQQMLQNQQVDLSSLSPEMRARLEKQGGLANLEQNNPQSPSMELPSQAELKKTPEKIPENPLSEVMMQKLRELYDLLSGSQDIIEERLKEANILLLKQPRENLRFLMELAAQKPPDIEALPDKIKSLYVGKDGSLLIMAYPKYNIWEMEHMKKFIDEMREIDPEVTGTPIQVYESSRLMRRSFIQIGVFSYITVAILVFLDFVSLSSLFFVLFPLTLGVLWLVEIMGIFNVNLNLANFFAIPILIGIGVDNAVHFYHRYLETQNVEKTMYTTGTTLTLTTMTTIVGFGSLIFASHKGLASLGTLMAMGSATCWFACVVFLPTLIKSISKK